MLYSEDEDDKAFLLRLMNINLSQPDLEPSEEIGIALSTPSILSIVTYTLTFLLGVPGNVVVIWVSGFKKMGGKGRVGFLNLAVADLTYCLTLPFLSGNVASNYLWPRDNVLCKLLPSAIVLNMSASVFLLTLISVDRCFAVFQPFWYRQRRNACKHAACLVAWGLAFLMCLPTLLMRQVVSYPETGLVYCSFNYTGTYFGEHTKAVVEVTRATLAFAIPFLIMASCYLLIGWKLKRGKVARYRKPIRLISVVLAAFFLCWLPYHICGLAQAFSTHRAALLWDNMSIGLASLNSALNPILYVSVGQNFRQVFKRSPITLLRQAFTDEADGVDSQQTDQPNQPGRQV
ncbi:C3a anaphylatoxin chemotactic receptor-like [Hypanus sabinus]|uniref:C3a anaphylatoxin chemotactic receptor-like n=1 Tax=Hypanus sabinus TaxID=79690 RepID=UPI0028C50CAC|nr:C3a anaphylatoxin chemotactic receptor-like [Hypanus sabinus]